MLAFPKPGKMSRRSAFRDGREVCRGEAWEQRRKECHDRAGGRCEGLRGKERQQFRCNRLAPFHSVRDPDYGEVIAPAGHAHHKNGTRGLGGGKRDDRAENLAWLCNWCHRDEHVQAKVVPSKSGYAQESIESGIDSDKTVPGQELHHLFIVCPSVPSK